ncbi:hypothetical protein [Paeniglutamicibacter cryotolerans]|uniref:DUF2892 domain-containing protein n=1 Tax=Paeniglutamicibacter cryotolerans TaxID=670079 RepID=A0A839QMQ8_9MICC|nr:hypothetical protein [Paeniglutamicibacter cryotolerans]MBB2997060.1 hypothetical protein [Paeniglutamicibacter cryotolerans]
MRMAAGSLVLAGLAVGRLFLPQVRIVTGVLNAALPFSATTNIRATGKAQSVMP